MFGGARTNNDGTSKLSLDDVQPGDVVTISPEPNDFISKMISLLTGEDVSHAAMVWSDTKFFVEQTPPLIKTNLIADHERFKGRTMFVNRLKPGSKDMAPVLAAADKYLKNEVPYGMKDLYIVGVLLLTQKTGFLLPYPVQVLMTKLFARITSEIIEWIDKGEEHMFCSQLVYQCYEDAGEDFDLGLQHAVVPLTLKASSAGSSSSLLSRVCEKLEKDGFAPSPGDRSFGVPMAPDSKYGAPEETKTDDDVAKELYEALTGEGGMRLEGKQRMVGAEEEQPDIEDDLVLAVSNFAAVFNEAQGRSAGGATTLSSAASDLGDKNKALKALHDLNEAQFVTPADLYNRCTNLERVGAIEN